MAQYLLNFHHFPVPAGMKPTPEEFETVNQQWKNYIGGIVGQGKFISTQGLGQEGSIISPAGMISDVVSEDKGLIVGTLTLEAESLEDAVELAKTCPILFIGGSVEVRPILTFNM